MIFIDGRRLNDHVEYLFAFYFGPFRLCLFVGIFAEVKGQQITGFSVFAVHIVQQLLIGFLLVFFTVPQFQLNNKLITAKINDSVRGDGNESGMTGRIETF